VKPYEKPEVIWGRLPPDCRWLRWEVWSPILYGLYEKEVGTESHSKSTSTHLSMIDCRNGIERVFLMGVLYVRWEKSAWKWEDDERRWKSLPEMSLDWRRVSSQWHWFY
jgi:hypothetical protein